MSCACQQSQVRLSYICETATCAGKCFHHSKNQFCFSGEVRTPVAARGSSADFRGRQNTSTQSETSNSNAGHAPHAFSDACRGKVVNARVAHKTPIHVVIDSVQSNISRCGHIEPKHDVRRGRALDLLRVAKAKKEVSNPLLRGARVNRQPQALVGLRSSIALVHPD